MRAITLDEAVTIINETFAEAKRRNAYPLTAVLLDAGGRMKCAMKQDGASLLRFEVSYGKAYAALAMGRAVAPRAAEGQGEAAVHAVLPRTGGRADVPGRRRPADPRRARAR